MNEEWKERMLAAGERVEGVIAPLFPDNTEMKSNATNGNLLIRIFWPAPMKDRPYAHGIINLIVADDDVNDFLLPGRLREAAEQRLFSFVEEKVRTYTPKPSKSLHATPEVEEWRIAREDIYVR